LAALLAAISPVAGGLGAGPRPPAPVDRWDPPDCGAIDLRITADGRWLYQGSPITRPAMVRLFASVLKREGSRTLLVTPVEKLEITVEDAPFQAVEMAVDEGPVGRSLSFRTDMDEVVTVGEAHALRFVAEAHGGLKPYVHVRRDLWARLTRPLAFDLLGLAETRQVEGVEQVGIHAGGRFWLVDPAVSDTPP
jgi:hypothetical protein